MIQYNKLKAFITFVLPELCRSFSGSLSLYFRIADIIDINQNNRVRSHRNFCQVAEMSQNPIFVPMKTQKVWKLPEWVSQITLGLLKSFFDISSPSVNFVKANPLFPFMKHYQFYRTYYIDEISHFVSIRDSDSCSEYLFLQRRQLVFLQ